MPNNNLINKGRLGTDNAGASTAATGTDHYNFDEVRKSILETGINENTYPPVSIQRTNNEIDQPFSLNDDKALQVWTKSLMLLKV